MPFSTRGSAMPEPSSSDSRLLEPAGVGYELVTTTDANVFSSAREFAVETEEREGEDFVKKSLGVGFWISVGWFVFIVALMFLAPLLTNWGVIKSPAEIKDKPFLGISAKHLL